MKNLIFTTLLTAFSAAAGASNAPANLPQSCFDFIKKIESKYEYDWVKVQETPGSKSKISVFYYHLKSSSMQNPVIFFNGGPGYSSHGDHQRLEGAKTKFGTHAIDFVHMDQRGTGCSTSFPVGGDKQTLERLKWYGTHGIVSDAEQIREKLIGSRKWKVFGQSFGALVVHRYISMFPASIEKAFAHGNAVGMSDLDITSFRIASQNIVLQTYIKEYPVDKDRLMVLNAFLSNKHNCIELKMGKACGYEILTTLVYKLGFRDEWSHLSHSIKMMVPAQHVNPAGITSFLEANGGVSFNYHDDFSIQESSMTNTVYALNVIGYYDTAASTNDAPKCQKVYQKLQAQFKGKSPAVVFDECRAPVQFDYHDQLGEFVRSKIGSADPLSLEVIKQNLMDYRIPLHLYSGSMDTYVPKEVFQIEAKTLGKLVNYTNFQTSGHEGYFTERKVFQELQ